MAKAVNIDLDEQASQILADALTQLLGNLSYEIANTDSHEFREELKQRRDVLKRICDSLG